MFSKQNDHGSCSHRVSSSSFVDSTVSSLCRQWFVEMFLRLYSNFHDIITPFKNLFLIPFAPRARRTKASNSDFWSCTQRCLQTIGAEPRWYYKLKLVRYSQSSKFYIVDDFSQIVLQFVDALFLQVSEPLLIFREILASLRCFLYK